MGILSAFGGLSRVLGPIFVGYIYRSYGVYHSILPVLGMLFVSLILTTAMYKRLVPLQMTEAQPADLTESSATHM